MNITRAKKLGAALFAAVLIGAAGAPSARAADCVSVDVVVLGQTVKACVPTSALPTVKVTVPVPGPTITVPAPRVTVNVPGPVRTVTNAVPGPTVTRNVNLPGSNSTVTAPGPTVTNNSTQNSRATVTSSQPDTTSTSKSGTETITKNEKEIVTITKTKALGYGLLFAALGALLALVIVGFLAYRLGWRLGDNGNRAFLDELRNKNRKH